MKATCAAAAAIVLAFSVAPVRAVPPTVTPSPGYDARLQEQRTGSTTSTVKGPVAPISKPPRRGKRTHPH